MKLYIRASEMSYSEFQNEYAWSLKKYPDVSHLFGSPYSYTLNTVDYEKQGGRWVEVDNQTETINLEQYMNIIDATPFFKNIGGIEKVKQSAVVGPGYIPTEIESISPTRDAKTIRKFTIKRIG